MPSYVCIREGPDHAPRFKAIVNFNGENFESPHYCTTLRQAEHAAAEVALNALSNRGPSHSLAARILVSVFILLLFFPLGFRRHFAVFSAGVLLMCAVCVDCVNVCTCLLSFFELLTGNDDSGFMRLVGEINGC